MANYNEDREVEPIFSEDEYTLPEKELIQLFQDTARRMAVALIFPVVEGTEEERRCEQDSIREELHKIARQLYNEYGIGADHTVRLLANDEEEYIAKYMMNERIDHQTRITMNYHLWEAEKEARR